MNMSYEKPEVILEKFNCVDILTSSQTEINPDDNLNTNPEPDLNDDVVFDIK